MKFMRATLLSHTQWFKLQMCTDPFADLLHINALKDMDAGVGATATSVDDSKLVVGSGSCLSTTETSVSQPPDLPRDGPLFDEASVLTLMVSVTKH